MNYPGFGIVEHRLAGIRYEPSPNKGGPLTPRLGVIHYTGGSTLSPAVDHMCNPTSKVSAHVAIGRDGKIVQLVPFNVIAWHAGASVWKGQPACNSYSIGIELVNCGYLATVGIKAKHKNGGPVRTWQEYPDVQIQACAMVAQALRTYYGITEWVGHDDIAPSRKSDPGPAFPWDQFRASAVGSVSDRKSSS